MKSTGEICRLLQVYPESGEQIASEYCTVQEDADNASSYAARAVKEVTSLLSSNWTSGIAKA